MDRLLSIRDTPGANVRCGSLRADVVPKMMMGSQMSTMLGDAARQHGHACRQGDDELRAWTGHLGTGAPGSSCFRGALERRSQ